MEVDPQGPTQVSIHRHRRCRELMTMLPNAIVSFQPPEYPDQQHAAGSAILYNSIP